MAGARGEQIIELPDGEEIRILFTNFALANAEERIKKPVLGVARDLLEGQAGIGDVAQLLRAGMESAGRNNGRHKTVSLQEAYGVMDQVGLTTVIGAVMEAMTAVLMYRGDAPAKDDAPN